MFRKWLVAVVLAFAGCMPAKEVSSPTHRITHERWDKTLKGATKEDVKRLLGPPAAADRDGVWTYHNIAWNEDTGKYGTLYIVFKGDTVLGCR